MIDRNIEYYRKNEERKILDVRKDRDIYIKKKTKTERVSAPFDQYISMTFQLVDY